VKSIEAVHSLAALAQDSRLAVFRLLVRRGPEGYTPGELAERLKLPAPTLSFHLKALAQSGLISARRESRFLYYSPNFNRMHELVSFLTENCCSLATSCVPEACAPTKVSARRRSA
jgi:DNA-binding transcriptional ArsR family regulator